MTTKIRKLAEDIVRAYGADVLTGSAPGISLADMIECNVRELVAAERQAQREEDAGVAERRCEYIGRCNSSRCVGHRVAAEIRAGTKGEDRPCPGKCGGTVRGDRKYCAGCQKGADLVNGLAGRSKSESKRLAGQRKGEGR